MNDEQYELNLKFWQKERPQYPGSCSPEYQNQKQILVEKLLCWDTSKQHAKQSGVLGSVLAFMIAHEEQGRFILHSH